jgi:hypothetical protein
MSSQPYTPQSSSPADETAICLLYQQLLDSWNKPAVNTIQTLVAAKHNSQWRVALFQNTPAQFQGRPELSDALTEELRQLL